MQRAQMFNDELSEDLNGLQGGNFEELVLPLLDRLHSSARWLTGNPDEARDLVQETFAKALKAFGSFHAGTNFGAWIFTILRNIFLNTRTSLKKQADCWKEYEAVEVTKDNPERVLIQCADTKLVHEAIAKLPPEFRKVLLLVDIEEMSYRDVAEVLGLPAGTIMSRLSRGRKKLREHLVKALPSTRRGRLRKERTAAA
ncbi:MAG TPA: sigma-70 family RNA polymerase sigma factor [Candidatus Angelobacter sp.]|nr:sigma-70 family RNA polymerase sigma factor [Candidatus Angelobacter sp.]